jgi:hypothetical protein
LIPVLNFITDKYTDKKKNIKIYPKEGIGHQIKENQLSRSMIMVLKRISGVLIIKRMRMFYNQSR